MGLGADPLQNLASVYIRKKQPLDGLCDLSELSLTSRPHNQCGLGAVYLGRSWDYFVEDFHQLLESCTGVAGKVPYDLL